ncbi:MAG: hypothetical protein QNJ37_07480 [Crocosphaera sp.]|nr:hypothetical protein [Crocosphaera sp.]
MIIKDLRQFAQRSQQWGKYYHCQSLIACANCLETHRQKFDSENLAKTVESFSDLVRSLE